MPVLSWNNLLNHNRKYAEKGDYSAFSPFERDYFAIVQSSYYRRLKEKTQVFPLETNDYVRTRMAHSTEVSSIAEILGDMIARRVASEHEEDLEDYYHPNNIYTRDSEDFRHDLMKVLACAGLLHDIGNPPFGHTGEKYIREWVKSKADVPIGRDGRTLREILDDYQWEDLINFEGNAQALRIATHIANPTVYLMEEEGINGLNLTYAVLGAIIKYPYSSLARPDRSRPGKMGFYRSEWSDFYEIAQKTGTVLTGRKDVAVLNPVMLIMEAADDIAYTFSDIDDFIKKESINRDQSIALLRDYDSLNKKIDQVIKNDYNVSSPKSVAENRISRLIDKTLFELRRKAIEDTCNNFMKYYDTIMNGTYNRDENALFQADDYIDEDQYKEYRQKIYRARDAEADVVDSAELNLDRILDIVSYVALSAKEFDLTTWMRGIELSDEQKRRVHSEVGQYIDSLVDNVFANVTQGGVVHTDASLEEYAYCSIAAAIDFAAGMTDRYVSVFLKSLFSDEEMNKFRSYEQADIMRLIQSLLGLKVEKEFDNIRMIFNQLNKYTDIMSTDQKVQIIKAVYADGKDGQIVRFINYVKPDGNNINHRYGEWLCRLGREIKKESESWDDLIDTVMQWIGLEAS